MIEAGQTASAGKAIGYLEGRLDAIDEPYALALVDLRPRARRRARSAGEAYDKLMAAGRRGRGRPALGRRPGPCRCSKSRRRGFAPFPGQVSGTIGHRGHRLRHPRPDRARRPPSTPAAPPSGWSAHTNSLGRLRLHAGHRRRPAGADAVRRHRRHRHRHDGHRPRRRRHRRRARSRPTTSTCSSSSRCPPACR